MTVTINPYARLRLPGWAPQTKSTIKRISRLGVRTHCADLDPRGTEATPERLEPAYDLHMGIDIGTSSAKVVIRHEKRLYAVPFFEALDGIDAYLLPTKLRKEKGEYCLNEAGRVFQKKEWENIKLNLMENLSANAAQTRMIALMALIIRYARAWLFTEHGDAFRAGPIFWTYTVGVPSDPTADDLTELWRELLTKAVIAAGRDADITDRLIKDIDPDDFDPDWADVRAYSELVAEATALSRNHPIEGSNDFIVVDVGSGTLDIVMMTIAKKPDGYGFTYTLSCPSVSPLGTFKCHEARLDVLEKLLKAVHHEKCEVFCEHIRHQRNRTLLSALPGSFEDYYEDIRFEKVPNVDFKFGREVFFSLNRHRRQCAHQPDLTRDHITKAHILLCGGGARCRLYERAVRGYGYEAFWTNTIWLRNPDVRKMLPIERLLLKQKIREEDHDRLIVAVGLTGDALEEVTIAPMPTSEYEDPYDRAYVSKEMV